MAGRDVEEVGMVDMTTVGETRRMTEMKMFVADIRSVAQMEDHLSKRFCTVHYFNRKGNELCGLHEGDNRVQMELVLDVQGMKRFIAD